MTEVSPTAMRLIVKLLSFQHATGDLGVEGISVRHGLLTAPMDKSDAATDQEASVVQIVARCACYSPLPRVLPFLLHPPLRSVGASIAMERERQQNDRTLVNGQVHPAHRGQDHPRGGLHLRERSGPPSGLGAVRSNNQPQVPHASTAKLTDNTCLTCSQAGDDARVPRQRDGQVIPY